MNVNESVGPNDLELTILMPCLNEELTLGTCIRKALTFLDTHRVSGEVLIADNGSTDRSVEIAETMGARVVHIREKGYGSALLGGIRAARGKYVVMGDSDDSYNFLELSPFLEKLREGNDLVMGNRFRGGIGKDAMPFLHKYLGNPVLSFIGRLFFRIPIGDFHCGLRGFNRERILETGLNTSGMEFASEMIVKSSLHGLKITEVPTTLAKDGRDRKPHLRTWRDGWRHLRFLLIYCPKWLFFYPGLAFLLLGLIFSVALIFGSLQLGSIRLDVHSLLYTSAAIFVGYQFVCFYGMSKIYGGNVGLLPKDQAYQRLTKIFRLERGLIAGVLLILAGVALTIWGFTEWAGTSFGDLDPVRTLRIVIPAVILFILGIQTIQNCFFTSLLFLRTRSSQN